MPISGARPASRTRCSQWPPAAASVAQGQRRILDGRRDGAELETPANGDVVLERDALGGGALDVDVNQAGPDRLADQPVDLYPRDAQPPGDLLLGLIAHIGEPSRPRGQTELIGLQPAASLSRPRLNFRSVLEKLFEFCPFRGACQVTATRP